MTPLLKDEMDKPLLANGSPAESVPMGETEVLNWDACIEDAPPRPGGNIQVLLRYVGRSQPVPVADPTLE